MELKTKLRLKYWLWNRQYYLVPIIPILCCWVPIIYNNPIGYTTYAIIVMALFWCLELIPLAATALLPMVLFPLFGVLTSDNVCGQYLRNTHVLIFGGLMVAIAIERWNLHRRIALKVLLMVGTKPSWLMFGFMSTTAFLSMWMNNTATTAMMIPIATAILGQLEEPSDELENKDKLDSNSEMELPKRNKHDLEHNGMANGCNPNSHITEDRSDDKEDENGKLEIVTVSRPKKDYSHLKNRKLQHERMCKGMILCIPYAANIGGTATAIGTPPNLILIAQIESLYGPAANVSFGSWMMLSLPGMLISLFFCWLWLQFFFLDIFKFWKRRLSQTKEQQKRAKGVIQKEYESLGPMTFAEKAVLVHFIILIILWMTRDPKFVPGWSVAFKPGFVTDTTTAIALCMSLFCFPSEPLGFMCRSIPDDASCFKEDEYSQKEDKKIIPLLTWKDVGEKMAWDVLILVGGGAAMAEACKASGLSSWLGEQLVVFGSLPSGLMNLLASFIVAALTEITSNTATATILLPIFAELATSLGVNPLYIMISATWACSYAFMLPVATPPNAIAFSHELISVLDMAKAGFILNILCVLVANFSINTFGIWIFDVKAFPDWANSEEATIIPAIKGEINCTEYFQSM